MKANIFNTVKTTKPGKNVFDLTHDVKLSGQMGNLIPVLAMECMPGDEIKIGAEALIRFAPLVAPVMHRLDVTIHYFFVPNRIVWDGWEDYVTDIETATPIPQITVDGTLTATQSKFLDYMGIPPFTGIQALNVNAIPFAGYQAIYNEYYRDENLIDEVDYQLADGVQVPGELLEMRRRAYAHDYFTAALPFAQKGSAVDIPLGVVTLNDDWATNGSTPQWWNEDGAQDQGYLRAETGFPSFTAVDSNPTKHQAFDPDGSLEVGATTINDLRRAFKLQEWLEKNARGGTRYIEQILMHFGVLSSDKRLQRPEYITGIKSPVVISEVVNTTGETGGLDQGNLAGKATGMVSGKGKKYFCEEHGYIIGIMSVMPVAAYQNGIPKTYLKKDPLELPWPSFSHLGEQEVTNDEIYAYEENGSDVFGYIPRYSEYKYMPSRVAGEFRTTLAYWHLGRIFSSAPTLSQEFIEVDPADNTRIFAVETGDNLFMHVLNIIKARRPLPVYGTPTL